ncbi:MAG: LysR family transcriptional regulator [Verrucomicrobiales bacterium]|nr:LysR family transcriptional regulator [Verrucomicrobiales bacterium]
MDFTLRQLEVFLAIAKAGNLTRAAQRLQMSQSAASAALKDLETQFDVLLFDRIGKRLHLNEQGNQLRPRAESLMAQAYELEQSLLRSGEFTRLNIGATLTVANYLAIQIVSKYLEKYTGAPISLEIYNTEQVVERVLNYELDMGMIEGEAHHPQLNIIPWRDDELNLFCSPGHPLASKRTINDEDLLNAEWILREQGSGTRQTFNRAMVGLLPKMKIPLELRGTEAIKQAVRQNIGVGCLSRLSLKEEFARGDLVKLHAPNRNLDRKLYLIMHLRKHISESLQNWLNLCECADPSPIGA